MVEEYASLPQPDDLLAGVNRAQLRACILTITQDYDAIEPLERQIDARLRDTKSRGWWAPLRSRTHCALEVAYDCATQWALENETREKEFFEAVASQAARLVPQPEADSPNVPKGLWPLIADLPERTRLAFILVRVHNKRIKQAARIAGVAPSTIKTQLSRAELHILQAAGPYLASARSIAESKDKPSKEQ